MGRCIYSSIAMQLQDAGCPLKLAVVDPPAVHTLNRRSGSDQSSKAQPLSQERYDFRPILAASKAVSDGSVKQATQSHNGSNAALEHRVIVSLWVPRISLQKWMDSTYVENLSHEIQDSLQCELFSHHFKAAVDCVVVVIATVLEGAYQQIISPRVPRDDKGVFRLGLIRGLGRAAERASGRRFHGVGPCNEPLIRVMVWQSNAPPQRYHLLVRSMVMNTIIIVVFVVVVPWWRWYQGD